MARLRVLLPDPARFDAVRDRLRPLLPDPARLDAVRDRLRPLLSLGPRRGAAAATVFAVAAFGLTAVLTAPGDDPDVTSAERPAAATAGPDSSREEGEVASRNHERAPANPPAPSKKSKSNPPKTSDPSNPSNPSNPSDTSPPSAAPTKVAPVGGLSQMEMDNALAIVAVAKRERLPKRAVVVALATALQESHLRNLANGNLPASLEHPNEGVGYDYDSVGLFQQRPSWGSIEQLMNPEESARRFYAALLRIPGWGDYAVTVAAQKVQGSAFPDAYAKWEGLANTIADATM
ncbi:hypothetical protein AB0M46_24495 [Dactylosporangium sp. NPDC051485]|uniref:hypothetical protein n=1 Tax=Dactylosporangium sp. NPDC051485 TaxID=3154846 RepID=UPI0034215AB3